MVEQLNQNKLRGQQAPLCILDFSTLYTSLPQPQLINRLSNYIRVAYLLKYNIDRSTHLYFSFNRHTHSYNPPVWLSHPPPSHTAYDALLHADKFIYFLTFQIENSFIAFGKHALYKTPRYKESTLTPSSKSKSSTTPLFSLFSMSKSSTKNERDSTTPPKSSMPNKKPSNSTDTRHQRWRLTSQPTFSSPQHAICSNSPTKSNSLSKLSTSCKLSISNTNTTPTSSTFCHATSTTSAFNIKTIISSLSTPLFPFTRSHQLRSAPYPLDSYQFSPSPFLTFFFSPISLLYSYLLQLKLFFLRQLYILT
eukprot:g43635.t1